MEMHPHWNWGLTELTHDFSLDEFEDEDLSQVTEITDECGANYDDLDSKDHVTWPANQEEGRAERRRDPEHDLELLQLDLIDAEDLIEEEEEEEEEQDWGPVRAAVQPRDAEEEESGAAVWPPPVDRSPDDRSPDQRDSAPVAMETYRPKRPTTLALFPPVPRTQDTINNNSFGKKDTWKESSSSSPHITGDRTPTQDAVRQNEDTKVQRGVTAATKHRGTAPASSSHGRPGRDNHAAAARHRARPPRHPSPGGPRPQTQRRAGMKDGAAEEEEEEEGGGGFRGRSSLEEPTEEIYLTPVQRDPGARPSLSQCGDANRMSISSDAEGPPQPHPSLPNRTNPSISEEEEAHPSLAPPLRGVSSPGRLAASEGRPGGADCEADAGLSYDSVKYTLVVDEHAKLELVSLKRCYQGYGEGGGGGDDSDAETVYESANDEEEEEEEEEDDDDAAYEEERRGRSQTKRDPSASSRVSRVAEGGALRARRFRSGTVSEHRRSVGAQSFGLFSCVLGGVEREQSHRAVFRFVPRHEDELELEVDDPLLMETQAEDLWCQAYNMRTGASGIFPAYYATMVNKEHLKGPKCGCVERFRVCFLGSVQVPYHKGNNVLCTAMQKIAVNRRMSMQPPSACVVEINLKGVKIIVQDECKTSERGDKCFHFFQLKNISFCGCHPKHNKYFGFITKHPDSQRFACHVVMSDDSSRPLAESVGRAFQQHYREHMGYSCPTEDIFLE